MDSLFGQLPEELEQTARAEGPVAVVALENALDKELDYTIPKKLQSSLLVGQRVKVPLGRNNKAAYGYVVAVKEKSEHPKIKPLIGIEDPRVLLNEKLMELTRWMSRYYCTPLGAVIESIIPSAVRKQIGVDYSQQVHPVMAREKIQELMEKIRAPKRRALLARLLQLEEGQSIELHRLAEEAGTTAATVRKLTAMGVIGIRQELDLPGFVGEIQPLAPTEQEIVLNDEQQKAFDELCGRLEKGFSVNLLLGVTGSGKTELYLQAIRRVVAMGKQAIVLVPEIALTPQTVRRFVARCPRVAVLHSGLSAGDRHRYWAQIAEGQADVIVGARSAIFAPTPRLGMIVVDEEHEASYKQDTAPRYHGRDVAIKRAQLEGVPIVLGSATPSLETYWKTQKPEVRSQKSEGLPDEGVKTQSSVLSPQSYHLLTLSHRVKGLALAQTEIVDMKQVQRIRGGLPVISPRLEHLLRSTVEAGHQAILLLNRRGYSSYVYCVSCQMPQRCTYCDAALTYHRTVGMHAHHATAAEGAHTGELLCHYCLNAMPLPTLCGTCGKKLSLLGMGTQKVEEELHKKLPNVKYARVDSDAMRTGQDYDALLEKFGRNEIHVLLGTQMLAKGLDYPNVTLVGVINADTALGLPDFRAGERTFQLITQVAGRAGRGTAAGRVIVQTFQPEEPAIQMALAQNFEVYAKAEMDHRRELNLPPFARMVRIVVREQEQEKLEKCSQELRELLADAISRLKLERRVQLKGPVPCAITRIAGYLRNQIVLSSATAGPLQALLAEVREKGHLAKAERIAVDVDPVSLL